VIQTFEPVGVGRPGFARVPAAPIGAGGQQESLEYRIVRDFMEALGKRGRFPKSPGARAGNRGRAGIPGRIGRLEPRPGRAFLPDTQQFVLPEVFVQKSATTFTVTTNDEQIPHLRISNVYKDLMSQGENNAEVKNYIREKIRAGNFLIKSLHQRQQTIANIGREIVKRQREFMEKGVAT
jgi:RNA polymerase sigma-54 factor